MTFHTPLALLLLFALPPLAAYWLRHTRARFGALRASSAALLGVVAPSLRDRLWRLPDVLRLCSLALLIVTLARPQTEDREELSGEGVDVMIALDMSGSMNAVDRTFEEIDAYHAAGQEPPNRFETARELLRSLVRSRREDRVGLVVFASEAYLSSPTTLDYSHLLDTLDGLVLDDGLRRRGNEQCSNGCTISGNSTAIGDALSRAWRRLQKSEARGKAVILITDGDDNASKLNPRTVARFLAERPDRERARVFAFLVGSGRNVKVPGMDPFTGGVARDPYGFVVYDEPRQAMPVKPDLLREIAAKTGGKFFDSYDADKFRQDFESLEKTEFKTRVTTKYREAYLPFAGAGLLLLLGETLLRLTVYRKAP